jgi:hypothetical protein
MAARAVGETLGGDDENTEVETAELNDSDPNPDHCSCAWRGIDG